jgi:hypothetical protein
MFDGGEGGAAAAKEAQMLQMSGARQRREALQLDAKKREAAEEGQLPYQCGQLFGREGDGCQLHVCELFALDEGGEEVG